MPNSWGYPKQVQEWVPEQPNTKLAERVAEELEKTIFTYQAGKLDLI